MLKVITTNGKNVTDSNEIITVNYVLEHTSHSFIWDYGKNEYINLQRLLNTQKQLEKICKYVYANNEDCYSSDAFKNKA